MIERKWTIPYDASAERLKEASSSMRLASGAAEIQFFSGAVMTVEGPAEIALKSACHF